jgi:hypothetical protein
MSVSELQSHYDQIIHGLAADLTPVRPLQPPGLQAVLCLAVVIVTGFGLSAVADRPAVATRLAAAPDVWLSALGSALTTVLAAVAAFQLSRPDRKQLWAVLPLPAAVLWVAASGVGCLSTRLLPGMHAAGLDDSKNCAAFILAVSIPLSVVLLVMLRRAYSLHPGLAAVIAGLASAAAAATLLNLFHPYDASVTDLVVHTVAVTLVVVANRAYGGRMLQTASA